MESPAQLPILAKYLGRLPREFRFAVEVRHFGFFDNGPAEQQLRDTLTALGMDWVLFDSRPLFSGPPKDAIERESQRRKPRTPYRKTVTAGMPILRLIGRNDVGSVAPWIEEWAETVAGWIQAGLQPFVFTHSPHDLHAPALARAFHDRLRQYVSDLPPLALPRTSGADDQRLLF